MNETNDIFEKEINEKNSGVLKSALKNAGIMLLVQIITIFLSIVTSFILPSSIEVSSFGYWQVYILYSSYAAFFYFGYNDGIYLRYGDYDYCNLPFEKLRGSNKVFLLISVIISFLLFLVITFEKDVYKQFSFLFVVINILFLGINSITVYIFQITNQIKRYSIFSLLTKILSLLSIIILIFIKISDFRYFVISDSIIKILLVLSMVIIQKELFFGKSISIKESLKEYKENIKVGIFLMISNFTGTLILGLGKIIAERSSSIDEYAKYAFANSSANLIIAGVVAISLVVYPSLKRLPSNKYDYYFKLMNLIVTFIAICMLIIYFPIRLIVIKYLVKYVEMLIYLPFLFIAVFMQSRMQLINNNFYNAIRKEKTIMFINVVSILLFLIFTIPIYLYTRNILVIAFTTMVISIIRCYFSEIKMEKYLGIFKLRKYMIDITMIIVFIYCCYIENLYYGFLLYFISIGLYFLLNKSSARLFFSTIKKLINSFRGKKNE